MIRIRIFIVVLIGLIGLTGCKSKEMQSTWKDQAITIDGDISDWSDIPKHAFESPGIFMGIGNDNDNLYILVGFENRQLMGRFIRKGATLWFDKTLQKKKDFGFRMVRGERVDGNLMRMERPGETSSQSQMMFIENRLREMIKNIYLVRKNEESVHLGINAKEPLAAYNSNYGVYRFEFKIPLRETNDHSIAIHADCEYTFLQFIYDSRIQNY